MITSPFVSRFLFGLIFAFLFTLNAAASDQLWSYKGAKWYSMLETGNLLVGTETGLLCVSGENGQPIWQRNNLVGIKEDEFTELAGTPLLLIADNSGTLQRKTKLFALDLLTGETVWETDKLKGFTAQVSPLYKKDMLVFLTIADNRIQKDKPDITALKLSTGELLWQAEYTDKVDLYGVEKTKKSGFGGIGGWDSPRFDLSGENEPVFDEDSMYLTYAGLHRYDLKDGRLVWKVPYDVTEGSLKHTNGQAIVDGETIYTSARGVIRAINKADGAVKWQTVDLNKGGVAEMKLNGDVLYGRLGGVFYSHKKREYEKKTPIGVVALNKANGNVLWNYTDAKNSITNMVLLPEQNQLLIADEKNLIALDTTSTGKVKEAFKLKLEFKNKLGAVATAAKIGKFAFGGLSALGSKGADTTDEPVALVRQENGTVVARGKQHLLAFDPKTRQVVWSTKYEAPGMPAWQKVVMTAITMYAAAASWSQENRYNFAGDYSSASNDNSRFINLMSSYERFMEKRMSATKQEGNFVYVLTKVKSGKDDGSGLVGVNLTNGQGFRQILIKDKKPDYEVDEAAGRLFNLDDGNLVAYKISEAVPQAEDDDDKKDKKKDGK